MSISPPRAPLLSKCIVFVAAILAFSTSWSNQFALDDLIHIVQSEAVRGSIADLFRMASYPGNLYRPVTNLTYALTYRAVGLDPLAYHLTNTLLHALVCLAVLSFIHALGFKTLSLPIALLFAVHPLHTEAVANVSGRAELLAALFGMGALRLAIQPGRKTWLSDFAAFTLLILAMLSKESALVFALLLLLTIGAVSSVSRLRLSTVAAFCAAPIVFICLRTWVVGSFSPGVDSTALLDNPLIGMSTLQRLPVALALLGKSVSLTFLPYPLSADYSLAALNPAEYWHSLEHAFELLLAVAFLILVLVGPQRQRVPFFFCAWFLLSFALTANVFFPIGTIFAERLSYLPSIGSIGLLCWVLSTFLTPTSSTVMTVSLCIALGTQSFTHARVWESNRSLHRYQMEVSSASAKTRANYAAILRNEGQLEEASVQYREALAIYPQFANAASGLASVYSLKGIPSGAEHWYFEALKIEPGNLQALEGLGRLYLSLGRIPDAEKQFDAAMAANPKAAGPRLGILAVLIAEGKLDEARALRDRLRAEGMPSEEFSRLSAVLDRS